MKRLRYLSAAVILMLGITLSAAAVTNEIIYFTAINNTILNLEKKTMPIKYKSMIYVPFKVFNSGDLGVYAIYSKSKQVVLLSNGDVSLYYDMNTGNSYDAEDNQFVYSALFQNDTVYIPAYFTADFFGLSYSYIRVDNYHIVRLISGDALSETDFLAGAASVIQNKVEQYREDQEEAEPTPSAAPESSPKPGTVPTTASPTPTPKQSSEPEQIIEQPVDRSMVCVKLVIHGLDERTHDLLDELDKYEYPAAFFVTAEDICQYPEIVRRITGEGYTLGCLIGSDSDEEFAEFLDILDEAVHGISFFAASDRKLSDEERASIKPGILLLLEQPAQTGLEQCERTLKQASDSCCLVLRSDFASRNAKTLLTLLKTQHYTVVDIVEK